MGAVYSPRWHRVAGLKPQLAPQLRLRRQWLRGERWYLLTDPLGNRSVRLNGAGHAFAGRLDGQHTVQQLWDGLLAQGDDPATQDELIDLLARLREAGLVQFDRPADFGLLLPHLDELARPRGRRSLLAWRVPLADPTRVLDRLQPLQRLLFSRAALLAWVLAMLVLLGLALQHAPTLWAQGQTWLATPRFALLALLLYVPIKLVHELAHGLAVRRWGGQVHEAGVTLMLLMPVPYVDASAAAGFGRRQRFTVSAAGIMAELALAAAALPLWLWLDDGLARELAFVTLFITGVSTVLFNANPLQRLDGYFMLTDALALPNLATRSRQWWLQGLLRRALRLPGAEAMPVARGETPWLAAYAPLAWLYGVAVAAVAVAWLGQWSLVLGLLCAALFGWQLLLAPPWRLLRQLRRAALAQAGTAQRWRRLALGAAAAGLLALMLPLPQHMLVQAVVWPSERAQLRAAEDGFVQTVEVPDGALVQTGQLLLRLANPQLQSDLERQRARVAALETEVVQATPGAGAAVGDSRLGDRQAELGAAQSELKRLGERVQALEVHAQAAGRVAWPGAADLPGRFIRRGSLLGRVLTDEAVTLRVALPESEVADLRRARRRVGVRLASARDTTLAGTLLGGGGGAVLQLPSAALSTRHGGHVLTDPRDHDDLKPMQPVVLLDVRLDAPTHPAGVAPARPWAERIGERAWVRFDAGMAPAALQGARALQRQVQRRFNPQF